MSETGAPEAAHRGRVVLREIAEAHRATPRQVAIRFLVRRPSLFTIPNGGQHRPRHRKRVEGCPPLEGRGVYYAATVNEAQMCRGSNVGVGGGGNSAGQARVLGTVDEALRDHGRSAHPVRGAGGGNGAGGRNRGLRTLVAVLIRP